MRFSTIHKVSSYLMVLAAFESLVLSGQLSRGVILLTALGIAISFLFDPSTNSFFSRKGWIGTWNAAALIFFGWTVIEAFHGDLLAAGVRFLCFLLVNKLWNRRKSTDYLQAYVVSFLMLVAGAALSTDLSYAACFLAYVVFATWTLILFHLRREMEENYLLKHSTNQTGDAQSERVGIERILRSRRIVGFPFLAGTSLVSLGIFAGATLTFFLIPRFGFGFFVQRSRPRTATVGFSERVDLGEYGVVKNNPQVVMRVELPEGQPKNPLRFRGISFDRYNHGHWSRTKAVDRAPSTMRRWGRVALLPTPPTLTYSTERLRQMFDRAIEQQIYLEPLDTGVLFGAPTPIGFSVPQGSLQPSMIEIESRGAGEVYAIERRVDGGGHKYSVERKTGLRYTVYSDPYLPSENLMAHVGDLAGDDIPDELAPYLTLPQDLPPRIAELARKVTAHVQGPFLKALALEEHLRSSYRYTLDLKHDERYEPIEDFLFVQKAGHCEYFASAMAIMLRTVGVPSRSVNGFAGGEWNGYGNYLAIRQGDAHSWVEVWLKGIGWVTFDPTPIGPNTMAGNNLMRRMRQMLDTFELHWFKYVIEYDLSKQADLFSGAGKVSRRWFRSGTLGIARKKILLAAIALVLLGGGWWYQRHRIPRSRNQVGERAAQAYERAVDALRQRGLAPRQSETGRELASRATEAADPAAQPFSELVELYYSARFGRAQIPEIELDRLAHKVTDPGPVI